MTLATPSSFHRGRRTDASLVYATWHDDSLGAIRAVGVDGSRGREAHHEVGHYVEPRFSGDGGQIVFRRIGGDGRPIARSTATIAASTRSRRRAASRSSLPKRARIRASTGQATAYSSLRRKERRPALISVNLAGGERRVHLQADNATEFVPSPDERFVAWVERFNAYVAPLPLTGKGVDVEPQRRGLPGAAHLARCGCVSALVARFAARVLGTGTGAVPARHRADIRLRDARIPRLFGASRRRRARPSASRPRPTAQRARLALVGATVITMKR